MIENTESPISILLGKFQDLSRLKPSQIPLWFCYIDVNEYNGSREWSRLSCLIVADLYHH